MDLSSNKAIIVKAFGNYDCLSVGSFALGALENNIEVKVAFCGLNFADLYTRQGLFYDRKLPFVLGIECVGLITAVGFVNDNSFQVGQRVICYNCNGGLFQDIIRIDPKHVYPLPDYISFETGAALFVNYLTAYFALFDIGNLKENQTVFIQSCAGGVGLAATQLAKTVKNVTIIGTCSENKHKYMNEYGVDFELGYDNIIKNLKEISPMGLDLIVDNQSGSIFNELQCLLKPLGRIVAIGANTLIPNANRLSIFNSLKVWWNTKHISVLSLIEANKIVGGLHLGLVAEKEPLKIKKALEFLYALVKDGKITPKIDSVWAFQDIVDATKVLGERRNIGKVLLSVDK